MMLIGLAGLARSGKDTAAAALTRRLGLYQHAFADPIKRMLEQVFGDNFVAGDRERIEPISGVSYRKLMQTLGTEWGRSIQPDLWTRVAKAKWDDVRNVDGKSSLPLLDGQPAFKGLVISDVRFDNEAEWIRSEGGIIVHIGRPNLVQVGVSGHASEAGLTKLPYDLVVENDSSLDTFLHRIKVVSIMLRDPRLPRSAPGVYEVRP